MPCRRRGLCSQRQALDSARTTRSDPLRGGDQLAAAADVVRHRTGGGIGPARYCGPRATRRGRKKPAGSCRGSDPLWPQHARACPPQYAIGSPRSRIGTWLFVRDRFHDGASRRDYRLPEDERARSAARHAIALFRDIARQRAIAPFIAAELGPLAAVRNDKQLEHVVRTTAVTAHHPAGTCRMGTDPVAVVDPELRVHGTEGLRVVDASVFPDLIGGNINAAVVMIAERASDLMRGRAKP